MLKYMRISVKGRIQTHIHRRHQIIEKCQFSMSNFPRLLILHCILQAKAPTLKLMPKVTHTNMRATRASGEMGFNVCEIKNRRRQIFVLFAARYFHLTLAFLQIKNARRGSRILIEFRGTESR
jgi:hypothetical protein